MAPNEIQLGISYISSVLKKNEFHTKLLVLEAYNEEAVDKSINAFQPFLICFSSVFREYKIIKAIAAYIKNRYPGIFLLAGGSYISISKEDVIDDAFDALCIGEGEYAVLELARCLQKGQKPSGIMNLWIKTGNACVEKNATRPFIDDLDSLPFPDRSWWDEWIQYPDTHHVISLARGCPFLCTYCCNHILRHLAEGKYVRFRSSNSVFREIEDIIAAYPKIASLYFESEMINVKMDYIKEFAEALTEFNKTITKKFLYGTNIRIIPGQDYAEIFRLLKMAGFNYINLGIESGSEKIRSQVLKREYSNMDIVKVVQAAKKNKIFVSVFIMVGLPGETATEFKKTVGLVKLLQPGYIFLSIFYPYPGTELYALCREKGLLHDLQDATERREAVLDLPGFSKSEIQDAYAHFHELVGINQKKAWINYMQAHGLIGQ